MEGVVVTDLWSEDSLRAKFALFGWDTDDPVTSLSVTTTKSLVTLAKVAVFVPVILVSTLSVGGTILSMDVLLFCRLIFDCNEFSLQFVLLCITSDAEVIN